MLFAYACWTRNNLEVEEWATPKIVYRRVINYKNVTIIEQTNLDTCFALFSAFYKSGMVML